MDFEGHSRTKTWRWCETVFGLSTHYYGQWLLSLTANGHLFNVAKHTYYMTTIDLRSAYHQVSVNGVDRDKTGFVSPFGMFRYLRMPFGL